MYRCIGIFAGLMARGYQLMGFVPLPILQDRDRTACC